MIKINLLNEEHLQAAEKKFKRQRQAEKQRRYRASKTPQELSDTRRKYYANNKERISELRRQRYEVNKDRILARCRQQYAANREQRLEYARQWRKDNPELRAEAHSRADAAKNGYAPLKFLPGETIAGLVAKQKGICPVCRGRLQGCTAIDHCHKTGRARAVLHNRCNRGLGFLKESSAICRWAADYLDGHDARISASS